MRFLALVFLLTFVACPLLANFEFNVEGRIVLERTGGEVTVRVIVEVDPRWGTTTDEEFQAFKQKHGGELPEVSGRAEQVVEATERGRGGFAIRLNATVSDRDKLPQDNLQVRGTAERRLTPYIVARVTIDSPLHRKTEYTLRVTDAFDSINSKDGSEILAKRTYSARLVDEQNRPASGVRVAVLQGSTSLPDNADIMKDPPVVVSDNAGRIHVPDEMVTRTSINLRVLDPHLAFDDDLRGMGLKPGDTAGGQLRLIPGGGVRFRVAHADTQEPAPAKVTLHHVRSHAHGTSRISMWVVQVDKGGEVLVTGIPASATAVLVFSRVGGGGGAGTWDKRVPLEIEVGKVRDLGVVPLEPFRTISVFARGTGDVHLPQYHVRAVQLSGFRPFYNNDGILSDSDPFIQSGTLSGEHPELRPLATGQWRLTITADGFAPYTTEVTIPDDESIRVILPPGGSIKLVETLRGRPIEPRVVFAVAEDAPAGDMLRAMPATKVLELLRDDTSQIDKTGIVGPLGLEDRTQFRRHMSMLGNLPPGTYTLFLESERTLRVSGVVVRAGEVTTAEVNPTAAANVRVRVTLHGQPRAGQSIHMVRQQQLREESHSGVSDADGMAKVSSVPDRPFGDWRVALITERELEWYRSLPEHRLVNYVDLEPHVVDLSPGDDFVYHYELASPSRIWLTVEVDAPPGFDVNAALLVNDRVRVLSFHLARPHRHADGCRIVEASEGGVFEFGPVRAGGYEIGLISDKVEGYQFYKQVEVNEPPEQTVKISIKLHSFTVTVRPAERGANDEYRVGALYEDAPGNRLGRMVKPHESEDIGRGRFQFTGVPEGNYRVVVMVRGQGRDHWRWDYVMAQSFAVGSSRNLTFNLRGQTGHLDIRATAKGERIRVPISSEMPAADEKQLWAELLDNAGNRTVIRGKSVDAVTRTSDARTKLWDIPAGTYTLRLWGPGLETTEIPGVTIRGGETASVEVELTRMAFVQVAITNLSRDALLLKDITFEALDVDGNVLPRNESEHKDIFQVAASDGDHGPRGRRVVCGLHLTNVPLQAAMVRIYIEGYQPIEIELEPGQRRQGVKATAHPD